MSDTKGDQQSNRSSYGPPASAFSIGDVDDAFKVRESSFGNNGNNNNNERNGKTFENDDEEEDDDDNNSGTNHHHSLPRFAPIGGYKGLAVMPSENGAVVLPDPYRRMSSLNVHRLVTLALFATFLFCGIQLLKKEETVGVVEGNGAHFFNTSPDSEFWIPLPHPNTVLTKIAFGSCSDQTKPLPHWDTISKCTPDLTILTGNNVYGDCTTDSCSELSDAYTQLKNHPSFAGAKTMLPIVATLDDHDYGQDHADSDNQYKDVAKQIFLDFFAVPASDARRDKDHDGVYTSYEWGPEGQRVQVILLDTRYSRSEFLPTDDFGAPKKERYMPDTTNDKQILSEQQWKWLEEQLDRQANVRIVVSSIQVLADGTGFECWRMLPNERRRLYDLLLVDEQITRTVILSGDRHVGGIYKHATQELYEVTSSSLTHTIAYGAYDKCKNADECDEEDDARITDFVRSNHFGLLELDWNKRELKLEIRKAQPSITGNRGETDAGALLASHNLHIP